jgi:hypothetical protein
LLQWPFGKEEVPVDMRLALFLPIMAAAPAFAQQFGEPLALAEPTGISALLADPAAFEGELVQVRGTVADVCPHAGCWVAIREDGEAGAPAGQITFKVDDGAMVFTPGLKGRRITAEGVVALMAPGPKKAEAHCEGGEGDGGDGDACGGCCEKAAPKPTPRLNGVGASVK